MKKIFTVFIAVMMLSGVASAQLFDGFLSFMSDGKCSETMTGSTFCAYPQGDSYPLSISPLLVVNPNNAMAGDTVIINDIQVIQTKVAISGSSRVDMKIQKRGSLDIVDRDNDVSIDLNCAGGEIICEHFFTFAYTIPASFSPGEYRMGVAIYDNFGNTRLSNEDAGSFNVITIGSAPVECEEKCGSWENSRCIGKTQQDTRSCQSGEVVGTGCATELEIRDTAVDCCTASDCDSGQVCSQNICEGESDNDPDENDPETINKKIDGCVGKKEGDKCEVKDMVLTLGAVREQFGTNYDYVDYTHAEVVAKFGGRTGIGIPMDVYGRCISDNPLYCEPTRVDSSTVTSTTLKGATTSTLRGATTSTVKGVTTTTLASDSKGRVECTSKLSGTYYEMNVKLVSGMVIPKIFSGYDSCKKYVEGYGYTPYDSEDLSVTTTTTTLKGDEVIKIWPWEDKWYDQATTLDIGLVFGSLIALVLIIGIAVVKATRN